MQYCLFVCLLCLIAQLSTLHPSDAQSVPDYSSGHSALVTQVIGSSFVTEQDRAKLQAFSRTVDGREELRKFAKGQMAIRNTLNLESSPVTIKRLFDLQKDAELSIQDVIRQTNVGIGAGVMHIITSRQDPRNLRVLTGAELKNFKTDAYLAYASTENDLPEKFKRSIQVSPIAIGKHPILRVPQISTGVDTSSLSVRQVSAFLEQGKIDTQKSLGPESVGAGSIGAGHFSDLPNASATQIASMDKDTFVSDNTKNTPKKQGNCGIDSGRSCFLFSVSLHDSGTVRCSGVQIAPGWVLTAAHCTCNGAPELASIGQTTPNRFGFATLNPVINPGTTNTHAFSDTSAVSGKRYYFGDTPGQRPNTFCEKHLTFKNLQKPSQDEMGDAALGLPTISDATKAWLKAQQAAYGQYDLALLKLSKPLKFRDVAPEAEIAKTPLLADSSNYRVAGFGRNNWEANGGHKTVLGGRHTGTLCGATDGSAWSNCIPQREMILVSHDQSSDSCNGDSGAGVFRVQAEGSVQLIAIVSRALKNSDCGPGSINVIVSSDEVRTWINTVLSKG